jgi:very-long-chain (3R)-3-hydroxyacyl-CoA dehydratase
MGLKDAYLIAYNCACCAAWAVVWYTAVFTVVTLVTDGLPLGVALSTVCADFTTSNFLLYAQTAALLEILHAMLRLVRSPVVVTFMQVMSRLVALVALVYSVDAQST